MRGFPKTPLKRKVRFYKITNSECGLYTTLHADNYSEMQSPAKTSGASSANIIMKSVLKKNAGVPKATF